MEELKAKITQLTKEQVGELLGFISLNCDVKVAFIEKEEARQYSQGCLENDDDFEQFWSWFMEEWCLIDEAEEISNACVDYDSIKEK